MSTAYSERTTVEDSAEQEPKQEPKQGPLEVIRAHPWASVLGAAAVGFLIARLVRSAR